MKKLLAFSLLILGLTCMKAEAGIFNPSVFKLKNGLQIIVIPNKMAPVVKIGVAYKVGTAEDPLTYFGISHFLEHLMFHGTKKYPKGKFRKLIADSGGSTNAFTSPDMTVYYTTISIDKLELILELEADRMSNLDIDEGKVKTEIGVVLSERRTRYDNSPFGIANDVLRRVTWWHHPYGTPGIGYPHHIKAYTKEAALKHYHTYYAPNNAILIVAGDVDPNKVKALAEKYFGGLKTSKIPERKRPEEPDHKGLVVHLEQESERIALVNYAVRYKAPVLRGEGSEHFYPLLVLEQIMAGNDTMRFYKKLVRSKKLATSASFYYDSNSLDASHIAMSVTLAPGQSLEKLKSALTSEVQDILKNGITEKELEQAKRDIFAELAFARDGNGSSFNTFIGVAAGFSVDEIDNWPDSIKKVTKQQILAAAKYVFEKDPIATRTVYPKGYRAAMKKANESKKNSSAA